MIMKKISKILAVILGIVLGGLCFYGGSYVYWTNKKMEEYNKILRNVDLKFPATNIFENDDMKMEYLRGEIDEIGYTYLYFHVTNKTEIDKAVNIVDIAMNGLYSPTGFTLPEERTVAAKSDRDIVFFVSEDFKEDIPMKEITDLSFRVCISNAQEQQTVYSKETFHLKTDANSSFVQEEEIAKLKFKTIYDKDGIKISIINNELNNFMPGYFVEKLLIENNTSKNLLITQNKIKMNGIVLSDVVLAQQLPAQTKAVSGLHFGPLSLAKTSDQVETLELEFKAIEYVTQPYIEDGTETDLKGTVNLLP